MKEYSKDWFRHIVRTADELGKVNSALTLHLLLNDLRNFIDYLDKLESRRGRPSKLKSHP